jgi:hypothetical protein
MHDALLNADIRCYELFRDGSIAFEREGTLFFGPASKLSALLSGSDESFLLGEEAKAKIAKLHALQRPTRSKPQIASNTDNFVLIRNRWEAERAKGEWSAQYVQALVAKIREKQNP